MTVTTRNQQSQQQEQEDKTRDAKEEAKDVPPSSPPPQKKQRTKTTTTTTTTPSSEPSEKNKEPVPGDSNQEQEQPKSSSSSSYQPQTNNSYAIAKNAKNQPLLNKLDELANAMFSAENANSKNHFKGIAIKRAVHALAQLDYTIPNGAAVSKGKQKVSGVGAGTAAYIDEFQRTGEIKEINDYAQRGEQAAKQEEKGPSSSSTSKKPTKSTKKTTTTDEKKEDEHDEHDIVEINRAPVLTLWVTVVAQREGYSRQEAVTYGKWVATVFAQAKGRALGKFETKKGPPAEEHEVENGDQVVETEPDHVLAFGDKKIPVATDHQGNRLAVLQKEPVHPAKVEDYLRRKFGNEKNLRETEAAMKELADNMDLDELKEQAYNLYTQIRPEWKGWGKKAALDLDEIREMAHS